MSEDLAAHQAVRGGPLWAQPRPAIASELPMPLAWLAAATLTVLLAWALSGLPRPAKVMEPDVTEAMRAVLVLPPPSPPRVVAAAPTPARNRPRALPAPAQPATPRAVPRPQLPAAPLPEVPRPHSDAPAVPAAPATPPPSPARSTSPALPQADSAAAAPTPAAAHAAVEIGIVCPTQALPIPPQRAIDAGISGIVHARALIRDGRVDEVVMVSGPSAYYAAVRAAMMKYRCTSTQTGGVWAEQQFQFSVDSAN